MKSESEKQAEREKKYKKWEPDIDSDFHWSKRGFSEWAIKTGIYFDAYKFLK